MTHKHRCQSGPTALHAPKPPKMPLPYTPKNLAATSTPEVLLRYHLPTARFGTALEVPAADVWVNPTLLQKIDAATAAAAGAAEPVDMQQSGDQFIPIHPVDHRFCASLIEQGRTAINARLRLP